MRRRRHATPVSTSRHALLAGAILAFFGFIHGTQLEVAASPLVALGYALMAGICFLVGWQEEAAAGPRTAPLFEEREAPAE